MLKKKIECLIINLEVHLYFYNSIFQPYTKIYLLCRINMFIMHMFGKCRCVLICVTSLLLNINRGDVQRKNVVNNVDKSSLWAP